MKKFVLLVLSVLFLGACTTMEKKDDTAQLVAGKTYELQGTIDESVVDMTFGKDKLSGNAGVNRYSAPYLISGKNIDINAARITRMMGPNDLMEQEAQFVKALENAKSIEVIGDKLIITSEDGKKMTFIEREMTFEEAVKDKTFTLVGSLEENKVTINFVDGRLAGNAGVNNYSTRYEVDGEKLTISPQIISTMMAGPEDAMIQEANYLKDLGTAEKVEVDGNKVLITLEDGRVLIFE